MFSVCSTCNLHVEEINRGGEVHLAWTKCENKRRKKARRHMRGDPMGARDGGGGTVYAGGSFRGQSNVPDSLRSERLLKPRNCLPGSVSPPLSPENRCLEVGGGVAECS